MRIAAEGDESQTGTETKIQKNTREDSEAMQDSGGRN